MRMSKITTLATILLMSTSTLAQTGTLMNPSNSLPAGYWPAEKSQPLIDKTRTIRLAPELSHLGKGEQVAVAKLLEVGRIFQGLYEQQRHAQALSSLKDLDQIKGRPGMAAASENLATLYRLFQGPIATTLDNRREPFLPVDPVQPGKNVYPWGVKREEIEAFLKKHPATRDQVLDLRAMVRRTTTDNLKRDLATLVKYPVLETLHPRLKERLEQIARQTGDAVEVFYAVPYSVAYADELLKAYSLLREAADAVSKEDEEFARYLRNRARDLLSDDYESGDAAWITGQFKNLNAQIGAYEVYDDELYGVKTFFALSLLSVRQKETDALRGAMKGLQAIEDSLPYKQRKKVREDIPVGVYDVIADFGQARGGNTATILPNESYLARRYGRVILLRANIMREPTIFSDTAKIWAAAVAPVHKSDLTGDGNFYRTLWHEVGHYLGVDRTKDGRDLDEALEENSSALEEMKADLVSLFAAERLHKQGYYTDEQLRSVYASGIMRVLQNNRPRRDQPYNTMQLMQWNYFLERGLLTFAKGKLLVNYDRYHDVVSGLLARVLDVQLQGNKAASDSFIDQYTMWDENLHGEVARNIRDQQQYRFRLFKYAALGE